MNTAGEEEENEKKCSLIDVSPEIDVVKVEMRDFIRDFSQKPITKTQKGSVKFILWGPEKSKQSICIKMGKDLGERMWMKVINASPDCNLEECGIRNISDEKLKDSKKDFDLIWSKEDTVYYREPATINKVLELKKHLEKKYPDKTVDAGIFNWSVYDRSERDELKHHSRIKKCESEGVKVDHVADFLKILNLNWVRKDFYEYFRELGNILKKTTLDETTLDEKKNIFNKLMEDNEFVDKMGDIGWVRK